MVENGVVTYPSNPLSPGQAGYGTVQELISLMSAVLGNAGGKGEYREGKGIQGDEENTHAQKNKKYTEKEKEYAQTIENKEAKGEYRDWGEVYRKTSQIKVKYIYTERQEIQRGRGRIWTMEHTTGN